MPRRAGRHKPSIGKDGGPGIGYNAGSELRPSLTKGGGGAVLSNPQTIAVGIDGSTLATWPTYEPLFTARPHIVQFEPTLLAWDTFVIPTAFPQRNVSSNDFNNQFAVMTDNLARAYANAQNLQLTTPGDLVAFLDGWGRCFSIYYTLVSIMNGDGFNDRMTQLAQTMTSFRSRIQTGYERLQSIPTVPGFTDILMRTCGCFADYVGGDVIINQVNNTNANGQPNDLTLGASITTLLAQAELELSSLQSASENGVIRIVLSEYFGPVSPLPWHGVKVHRGLYDQFHSKGEVNLGTTNVFAWPYVFNGTLGTAPGIVPITIPRGCEKDGWWQTLMRYQPLNAYSNVAKASAAPIGLITDFPTASSSLRYYVQNATTSLISTVPNAQLNGYTDPLNDFLWAPPAAATDVPGYVSDLRVQRDYTMITASFDYIVQQTLELRRDMMTGKKRLPLPTDVVDWNATRLQARRAVVNL